MKNEHLFLVNKIVPAILCMFLSLNSVAEQKPIETFGDKMPESIAAVSLAHAIEKLHAGTNEPQKISGRVTQVCRKKGCWMILTDDINHARVTFKDYKFFMPIDSHNRSAIVYGNLTEKVLSTKMARHYASDEGLPTEAINSPQKEYVIIAEAVILK